MIGAVIVFAAGWFIKRLWPTAVLFLLVFTAITTGLASITRYASVQYLGDMANYEELSMLVAYGATLLFHSVIFLIAFGLAKLMSKRRTKSISEESSNARNP